MSDHTDFYDPSKPYTVRVWPDGRFHRTWCVEVGLGSFGQRKLSTRRVASGFVDRAEAMEWLRQSPYANDTGVGVDESYVPIN